MVTSGLGHFSLKTNVELWAAGGFVSEYSRIALSTLDKKHESSTCREEFSSYFFKRKKKQQRQSSWWDMKLDALVPESDAQPLEPLPLSLKERFSLDLS